MAVFVLRAREKSVLLLVVPEKTGLENIQTSGEQLIKPQQFVNNRIWTDMRALCQQIWRRKKIPPEKCVNPAISATFCVSFCLLTCRQTGNQRLWPRRPKYFRLSRFVSPIQDFSDQGASSHIFSLAQYYTCVIPFFKSISKMVSFFGRQIFSLS